MRDTGEEEWGKLGGGGRGNWKLGGNGGEILHGLAIVCGHFRWVVHCTEVSVPPSSSPAQLSLLSFVTIRLLSMGRWTMYTLLRVFITFLWARDSIHDSHLSWDF